MTLPIVRATALLSGRATGDDRQHDSRSMESIVIDGDPRRLHQVTRDLGFAALQISGEPGEERARYLDSDAVARQKNISREQPRERKPVDFPRPEELGFQGAVTQARAEDVTSRAHQVVGRSVRRHVENPDPEVQVPGIG
jgi:hypothetical protein